MKKVIIAGSRSFNDYVFLKTKLDEILNEEVVIISGGAKGTDSLGKQYGIEKGYRIEEYLPEWSNLNVEPCIIKTNTYGKYNAMAGHNRNRKMLEQVINNDDKGFIIVFWDGKSKGTKNMIDIAQKENIDVKIVSIEG